LYRPPDHDHARVTGVVSPESGSALMHLVAITVSVSLSIAIDLLSPSVNAITFSQVMGAQQALG
jgi:hypothetical protein